MEQTKEKKYIVGSILCGLLTAFGIVVSMISLADGNNRMRVLGDSVNLMIFFLIIYYAFVGYKKPHGNTMKYIFLIRAASILVMVIVYTYAQSGEAWRVISHVIQIGSLCYIAGRLNKVKENLVLMIIVTVCIVIGTVLGVKSGSFTIGTFSPLIIWLDICVAYFLRYKQHREAGLEDAPKK